MIKQLSEFYTFKRIKQSKATDNEQQGYFYVFNHADQSLQSLLFLFWDYKHLKVQFHLC